MSWFDVAIDAEIPENTTPVHTVHTLGNCKKTDVCTIDNAETLMDKGFYEPVHTVHTMHTTFQSPQEKMQAKGMTLAPAIATLPANLLERVNLITQLEAWPAPDKQEWADILCRQIDRDGVPVAELVACLDAHLARWHPKRIERAVA
jgi:hypothetical protein